MNAHLDHPAPLPPGGQQNASSDHSHIPQLPAQSTNIATTDMYEPPFLCTAHVTMFFSFSERRAMLDMMNELRLGFKTLQHELEEERRARRQLESQIQRLFLMPSGK
jgi:hypothetical protein